ncbi:MAG: CapA family protein [Ketobacteraceae bacterium]|nr:CapA family protein [Ketobacteraceae bacterium]
MKPFLHCVRWCLLLVTGWFGLQSLATAHAGGACNPVTMGPLTERPPLYIHESSTFRVLGKRWSTSAELKGYFDQQKQLLELIQKQSPPADIKSRVKLASAGDVMRVSYSQPELVNPVLKEYLDTVDIFNANLETLISPRYPVPPNSLFMMNSDPSVVTAFRDSRNQNYFSMLSLANNHTFDYPDDAILDTLKLLREERIYQSGIRQLKVRKPYLVVEKKGIRIGYYAVTTFVNRQEMMKKSELHLTPMIDGMKPVPFSEWKDSCEIDLTDTARILSEMDADGADIKIVSVHWGIEHDMYPQPVQLNVAHQLVKMGADIIVGAHPHVPQPAEICFVNGYEETLGSSMAEQQRKAGCVIETLDGKPRKAMIYYSLGNLTSYSPFFWQQVGVIGEMELAKISKNGQTTVDWYSPEYVFTYDHVENPPHGKRDLNLLNTYIARRCGGEGCSAATLSMVNSLHRHLKGDSLSWWEELKVTAITTYDSIKNIIYWQFFAPASK